MAISHNKMSALFIRERLGAAKQAAAAAARETASERQDHFLEGVEERVAVLMKELEDYSKGRIPAWGR